MLRSSLVFILLLITNYSLSTCHAQKSNQHLGSISTNTMSSTFAGVSPSLRRLFDSIDVNNDKLLSGLEMVGKFSNQPHSVQKKIERPTYGDNLFGNDDTLLSNSALADVLIIALDTNHDGFVTISDFANSYPAPKSSNGVQQIHLSLTGVKSDMRVMFVILGERPEAQVKVLVECGFGCTDDSKNDGIDGNSSWRIFNATATTYAVPSRWWEPKGWQGWIYSATIDSLVPGQAYKYEIHSPVGNRTNLSMAVPDIATATQTPYTHLGVWGDMGTAAPLGFKVFDQVLSDHYQGARFNATMLFGDISYAGLDASLEPMNISNADELEYIWDLFGEQVEPLASEVPFMVGVGNHDMFYNASAFSSRFHMPWETSGGQPDNFWYSFDIGSIHVISASSEHDYSSPSSPQLKWLRQDLEKAKSNRNEVPWIVFTIHKPLYCSDADNGYNATSPRQEAFEPLLVEYNVDLVLVGHDHCYERIHPVINATVTTNATTASDGHDMYISPGAPVHVVIGSAGALQEERWDYPQPLWSAVRFANGNGHFYTDTFGYGSLKSYNRSHLSLEFVPISGNVTDFFWIQKSV